MFNKKLVLTAGVSWGIGFRNRANVLVNWAWNYLTYDRGSRVIVEPDPDPEP